MINKPKISITVGIDLSMNCTGLVLAAYEDTDAIQYHGDDPEPEPEPVVNSTKKPSARKRKAKKLPFRYKSRKLVEEKYYVVVPHEPKASKKQKYSRSCEVVNYNRLYDDDDSDYSKTDINKILSAGRLAMSIRKIVKSFILKYDVVQCECKMEGSVMASSFKKHQSRLNDLTAFNSIVKFMLVSSKEFSKISIMAPTSLKKAATGTGSAKKERMEEEFLKIKKDKFDFTGKIDDIIDAWFLATCLVDDKDWFVKEQSTIALT